MNLPRWLVSDPFDEASPLGARANALVRRARARSLWFGVFALASLVHAAIGASPPAPTPEGVAAMLGGAVDGEVRPDDFVWEKRGSFLWDAFAGRNVLFLAHARGQAQADLYRARVRVSRGGHPLALTSVRNLTQSRLGDERALVARGHHAAYATTAFGAVQGVTLLDLDGEPSAGGLRERATRALEAWADTGSARGIARTEITFGTPPSEAKQEIQGDLLVLALGKEGVPAALGMGDGALNTGAQNTYEAVVTPLPRPASTFGEALVRAVRELAGDAASRGVAAVVRVLGPRTSVRHATPPPRPPDTSQALATSADAWPPPRVAAVLQPAADGEGVWVPVTMGGDSQAPPAVFRTAVRSDPDRRESWVELYALDTRQIDLRLVAGVDAPRSEVGLHGTGRLQDPASAGRAVLAFAGPEEDVGEAPRGFIVDRRPLVAPAAGRASLALATDGRVEIGVLPTAAVPPSVVSVVQTRDALVGWTGPARDPLAHPNDAIERSAIGRTAGGQLIYAWSSDATASGMARALELAGAVFAVPLASAPARAGLRLLPGGEPAATEMSLGAQPLTERSPGPLLVALRRAAGAPPLGSGTWAPDGGRQPSPAWLPAVLGATVTSLGAQVHLTSFAPGRVVFRLRAGAREPATKAVAALPTAVVDAERARVVAAISLSAGKKKGARGLLIDGAMALPIRAEDAGALAIEAGRARIARASEVAHGFAGDAAELPLTADDGKLRPEARDVGTMRLRACACALEDGTFVVASTTFDSDEAATTALLDLGCSRVVALDRGTHQNALLDRAGVGSGPELRYEATVLFAVEVPLLGRASDL